MLTHDLSIIITFTSRTILSCFNCMIKNISIALYVLQLSKVFHAISNSDSVYRTSMENLIKVIDRMNQRVSFVEKNTERTRPASIDSLTVKNLSISVEELERKNKEIAKSLDETNYSLLQLGGQLSTARTQEVISYF